jgi:hypothetical protein
MGMIAEIDAVAKSGARNKKKMDWLYSKDEAQLTPYPLSYEERG